MTETAPQTGAATERAPRPATARPPKARPTARPPRKPNPVLERLFELYPKMFGARFLPLKLGAYQDLLAAHAEEFKKEDLKLALGLHARSTRYLESVATGEKRHDLQGEPVEDVAPEHVHHAIMEVMRRRLARGQVDAKPWALARLVQAIEASGLARQDYCERVRTPDADSTALLDEAFALLGAKNAKQEALRSAYAASGKSVAEFAEMYGMDPGQVGRLLSSGA